ncbi:MAG: YfaZ family protein [Natronospirillum sp.]|uniref:YfaZ family outer membrane protein n=1 Tax=Natronospirillum sp. TaxID=2812955 RepID=UPI0025FD39D1|nr:YfaZ family outer membrane protein [Natronospirillum sp.]MCH8551048.1 YfaZ family protein [Natronospirillum sp.]
MLKSMTRVALAALALGWSVPALAGGSVDIALTNESIRGEHGAVRAGTAAYLTVGGWYHLENGQMGHVGFHAIDPNNTRPELVAGLGGKGFLFKTPGFDTSAAVGLGGFVRYQPDNFQGFGGELAAYYSPPVLAFSSLEQFYDLQARLSYEVLPQGRVFVGYSHLQADYDDADVELDSSFTIGFRVRY